MASVTRKVGLDPTVTTLSPNNAAAGGPALTLTVNGTNFLITSTVQWNGSNRTTTFVSSTQLTAAIPASDIASAGTATVTVVNPPPGGATSNGQIFTISNAAPAISSLSPNSAYAGGPAFTLTVNGTGFVSTSTVQWNGSNRTTTFVSSTQVTAAITAADISAAGTVSVTVANPSPGGGVSSALSFTINNPTPSITSLTPASATVGGAAFTLTVNGTNFLSTSTVRWNGSDRTTAFVSATQLTAAITAADIATAGTVNVTVFNPTPGGGTSNGQSFTINNPAPALTSLLPASVKAGGSALTLTVLGSSFVSGSTVRWNGSDRTTTFVAATQLSAAISAVDIATAGTAQVTVFNPAPGGGTSGALTFTINNPLPSITSLSPAGATAGGAAFTLTVNGSNFVSTSSVMWNGSSRTTTFVSSTQLTAAITAADIASAGTASVSVVNPSPGGGTSGAQTFYVNNPVPSISSLSPASTIAGRAAFTLTVNGVNLLSTSTVQWNGSSRTTAFVNSTQLTASIPASDIATVGNANVTVVNPAPGGGTSSPQTFTINNPLPTLTSISPAGATAGGVAFTLTANGTNFLSTSTVQWNGSNRATDYVSATQLTALITAADIATAVTASVTVVNPSPGGGISNAQSFTINNPTPTLTSLSPSSTTAGGSAFMLTVSGSNFVLGSRVRWNGSDRSTIYVSATQLTAAITAADIASAGTADVTVANPSPGGGASSALSFTINNPTPSLTSLTPASATVGGAAFTLTVNGSNFVSTSSVMWNGSSRTTTFVSSTQLTAAITAADIASAGTASVTVVNPSPGGGTSSAQMFSLNNPVPSISSLSPSSAIAGSAAFTLTVNGTNFVSSSTIQWNGSNRTTTFVSSTQLTATIPASDIATVGSANVTVVNPSPGGGMSSALSFIINNPVPSITSLSPASATVGGAAFTLTVTGTNFLSTSALQWNGSSRTTTLVSST